jgi:hypothetical protein
MNANELADGLEDCEPYNIMDTHLFKAVATMLRQQQVEIEALKQSKSYDNNKVNFELTQDEILDIWYAMKDDSNNWTRYVDFARAILRKAQEK